MKINMLRSLPFFLWAGKCLLQVGEERRKIDAARAAGDFALEQKNICDTLSYWGPKAFARFKGSTMRMDGLKNIPEGPVLFVSNHQGYGDIIIYMSAVAGMHKQIGFVARSNLRKLPMLGSWITRVRSLLIERNDARAAVQTFKTGEEWLRQGFSLVIFPEGTRSHSNEMGEFKKGSLRLATQAGVPIVPVTLWNGWKLFEEYGYPHTADVRFFVHQPIETAGMTRQEQAGLTERVESVIRTKLEEWKLEGA
ncbi:MAG: 1-acyl-sn-glycerol-3-phosphate acyltransferase [Clostridiales Family XIII bacterium]|jgi:1-acyl-sn-glycerol-3-phosphate acyltransferase|nr:1-acyl-sn-glycerol-3-phosphate acyltransferase [Clostridiales Family XIII bacterium]